MRRAGKREEGRWKGVEVEGGGEWGLGEMVPYGRELGEGEGVNEGVPLCMHRDSARVDDEKSKCMTTISWPGISYVQREGKCPVLPEERGQ